MALAEVYDGGSRGDAARIGGVGLQTIRDWVLRFNARGPDGLVDGKAPGQRPTLSDEHRRALMAMIEAGPIAAVHGVVRWRLVDRAQWLYEEYGVSVTNASTGSAGPQPGTAGDGLPQALGATTPSREKRGGGRGFQKSFFDVVAEIATNSGGKPIEVWFQSLPSGLTRGTRRASARRTR